MLRAEDVLVRIDKNRVDMIDMVQNPTEVFDQLVETAAELARRSTEWRKLASSWMDDHPMKISEEEAAIIEEYRDPTTMDSFYGSGESAVEKPADAMDSKMRQLASRVKAGVETNLDQRTLPPIAEVQEENAEEGESGRG